MAWLCGAACHHLLQLERRQAWLKDPSSLLSCSLLFSKGYTHCPTGATLPNAVARWGNQGRVRQTVGGYVRGGAFDYRMQWHMCTLSCI